MCEKAGNSVMNYQLARANITDRLAKYRFVPFGYAQGTGVPLLERSRKAQIFSAP